MRTPKYKRNPLCAMSFTDREMMEAGCEYCDCAKCGHNMEVAEKRIEEIERKGLTLCEDGIMRYIVRRKAN